MRGAGVPVVHRGCDSVDGDWKFSGGIAGERDVASLDGSRESSLGKD